MSALAADPLGENILVVVEALGVSGVVKGVGKPDEAKFHSSSENWGEDGVEVLSFDEPAPAPKLRIMEKRLSALEIFCNLLESLGLVPVAAWCW